jgi:hypothetical protein
MLDKAIETYRRGIEADWRDADPGINAVTLMDHRNPPDPDRDSLLPVVRYAVERKLAGGNPDYWDCATMLELSVLQSDRKEAARWLGRAAIHLEEGFQAETTADQLGRIKHWRQKRGEDVAWIDALVAELRKLQEAKAPKK